MSTDFLTVVPPNIRWGLAAVGAVWLGSRFLNFVQFLVNAFILGGSNLRKYGKPGTWAVVTGASDGLGKEFAYQLASKGFNIVLVSRTQSKLEDLAKDIQAKFGAKGVQTKTLAMDYAEDNDADYQRLAQLVSGLDIGILINNVGQSHSIPVSFLQTSPQEMQNIITINCMGTLKTTKVVAPIMQRRKRGLIITMGSFGGWMPTPFLATYSGSKAFLQHWSAALASELQDDGIDVQFCLSYLVTTAMSKVRRTSLLIPNPRGFVRSALSKIGTGRWQNVAYTYTPWWSHALLQWVVENTVGASSAISIWYSHKMHVDIRNRALRKAAREAKKA